MTAPHETKKPIPLSRIAAFLGLIAGLGFLGSFPGNETRNPATSSELNTLELSAFFVRPLDRETETNLPTDRRENVLFDIHTVAKSRFAKDTDAYVLTRFVDENTKDEVKSFNICENYDYKNGRANTALDRYATGENRDKKPFSCYRLSLDDLKKGSNLIDTVFGPILSLRSKDFDPKKGGTLEVTFAHRVSKVFLGNVYRSFKAKIVLKNREIIVQGPKGEIFDWMNLTIIDDLINLPKGLDRFELFFREKSVSLYPGETFPKTTRP